MPVAPANIVGNFDAGADLYLAIQQSKQRKEQLKALADFHAEQIDNQIERLKETQQHHQEMEENAAKIADIRQQLADTQAKALTAKTEKEKTEWEGKVKHWQDQLNEHAREADQTAGVNEDRLDTETDIAGMRDKTANRGLDLRQKALDASLQLGTTRNAIAADTAQMHNDTAGFNAIYTGLQRDNAGKEIKAQKSPDDLAEQAMDIWETVKQKRQRAALMPAATPQATPNVPRGTSAPAPTATPATPTVKAGQRVKDATGKTFKVKQDGNLPPGYTVLPQ
jgi:hypothetical protein